MAVITSHVSAFFSGLFLGVAITAAVAARAFRRLRRRVDTLAADFKAAVALKDAQLAEYLRPGKEVEVGPGRDRTRH